MWMVIGCIGLVFFGVVLGGFVLALLALANKSSSCDDCLLHQQFLKNREEAHARHCQETEERGKGKTVEDRFEFWKN